MLLNEAAMAAGFGYAAVQILGQLQRFQASTGQRLSDAALFESWDTAVAQRKNEAATAASSGGSPPADFGVAAAISDHAHVFDDWRKLTPAGRAALIEDLAELAVWSGAATQRAGGTGAGRRRRAFGRLRRGGNAGGIPLLRSVAAAGGGGRISWAALSQDERVQLLSGLDQLLAFGWLEDVKEQAEPLAFQWLWQVNESLPVLAYEPIHAVEPGAALTQVREAYPAAEAAVRAALEAERRRRVQAAVTAVKKLDLAAAARGIESLKPQLEKVGLGSGTLTPAAAAHRTALARALVLRPADPQVAAEKAAAAQRQQAEIAAEVESVQSAGRAAADAGARFVFRTSMLAAAGAPARWVSPSGAATPLAQRAALIDLLLEQYEAAVAAVAASRSAARTAAAEAEASANAPWGSALRPMNGDPVDGAMQRAQSSTSEVDGGEEAKRAAAAKASRELAEEGERHAISELSEGIRTLVARLRLPPNVELSALLAGLGKDESVGPAEVGRLRALLRQGMEQRVPYEADEAVVSQSLRRLFRRVSDRLPDNVSLQPEAQSHDVLAAAAEGETSQGGREGTALVGGAEGAPAVGAHELTGPAAEAVAAAVKAAAVAEAQAKADATLAQALEQLSQRVSSLAASSAAKAQAAAFANKDSLPLGDRLLTIERYCQAQSSNNISSTEQLVELLLPLVQSSATADSSAASAGPILASSSAAAVNELLHACNATLLARDLARLELGPGATRLLQRVQAHLNVATLAAQAAAEASADSAAPAAEASPEELADAESSAAGGGSTGEEGQTVDADTAAAAAAAAEAKAKAKAEKERAERAAALSLSLQRAENARAAALDSEAVSKVQALLTQLLGDGVVLLELPMTSFRKLDTLRNATLTLNPEGTDAAVYQRQLTSLKELVGQLAPIAGIVENRLKEVSEQQRPALSSLQRDAVAIYQKLSALLQLETAARPAALTEMSQIKEAIFSLKMEKKAAPLTATVDRVNDLIARCKKLADSLADTLGGGEGTGTDAAAAVKETLDALEDQLSQLGPEVSQHAVYVRLREHAMGLAPNALRPEILETVNEDMLLQPPDIVGLLEMKLAQEAESKGEDEEEDEDEEEEEQGTLAMWVDPLQEEREDAEQGNQWRTEGMKLLAAGAVGVVMIAGGLTDSGELRGAADVGLPSAKCLLQLQAERILRNQRLAGDVVHGVNSPIAHPVPWYLMTTPSAEAPLRAFLADNDYFGLRASQVTVFACNVAPPLLNEDGKVVMETGGRVARGPAGSGELFSAMYRTGVTQAMTRAGVRMLEVHALEDDIMLQPIDPLFIGICSINRLDSAAKVIDVEPETSLADLYACYGRLAGEGVEEEIEELAPASGTYFFTLSYVRAIERCLEAHPMALYRMSPADKVPSKGAKFPGYRLERRLADWAVPPAALRQQLGLAPQAGAVLIRQYDEFAPVWGNAPFYTPPSPTAAVDSLLQLHTSWVEQLGGQVPEDGNSVVEISPLLSCCGEGLEDVVNGKTYTHAYELELQGFAPQAGARTNIGPWFLPFAVLYVAAAAVQVARSAKAAAKSVASDVL